MSHFSILVIGHDVDAAMAPYQENNFGTTEERYLEYEPIDLEEHGYKTHAEAIADGGWADTDGKACSVHNPNSFFDYYSEGGRSKDMILTKDGNLVNSARKGEIDFDTMYADAIAKATERYDLAMKIFGELPPHKTLKELSMELKEPDDLYPDSQANLTARKIWTAQPRVIAFETALEGGVVERYKLFPDDYVKTKEEYVNDCKIRRFITYGIVVAENAYGENEYHSMDWLEEEEFFKIFKETLDGTDDEEWLTILDCHV